MSEIEMTREARLLVLLDGVISDWCEEQGYADREELTEGDYGAIVAAVAWLKRRWA